MMSKIGPLASQHEMTHLDVAVDGDGDGDGDGLGPFKFNWKRGEGFLYK